MGQPIAQLEREAIERRLRRLHVSGRGEAVRQGVVVALRSLGEWCLAHGIIESNPGASLLPAGDQGAHGRRGGPAALGECARDSSAGAPGDAVLLGVAYVAGLRASEIGPLEVEGEMWNETTQTFSILVRHPARQEAGRGRASTVGQASLAHARGLADDEAGRAVSVGASSCLRVLSPRRERGNCPALGDSAERRRGYRCLGGSRRRHRSETRPPPNCGLPASRSPGRTWSAAALPRSMRA